MAELNVDDGVVLKSDRLARLLALLALILAALALIIGFQAVNRANKLEETKVENPGSPIQETIPQQPSGTGVTPGTTPNNSGGR